MTTIGGGSVSFASGSAALESTLFPTLDRIAVALNENPHSALAVVGHSNALRGAEDGHALSRRRAAAVADYLAEQGVSRDRMHVDGRGGAEPLAGDRTAAGRARNRRVEMRMRPRDES
jgi:outer membrane protein OmpA-like peptidoglycan-associated protein